MRFGLIERFKQLQRGPFKFLVALVATIQQTIKYRSLVLIYVDGQGDWYNRRRDVTIVAPELNVTPWGMLHAAVVDIWCYDYTPQNGDTVIDIGAGIGDDVVVFSRLVGKEGRVIALEAHPRTFRCLLKTISANNLENVTALNYAAADREGEVGMSDEDNYLVNGIVDGTSVLKVRAHTVDYILSEIGVRHADLVKINIEGAETSALHGMNQILHSLPHIVVSCHDFIADNHGGDPILRTYGDVNHILKCAGYTMREPRKDSREEVVYNVYGEKK